MITETKGLRVFEIREQMTRLPIRQFVRDNIFGQLTMADMDGFLLATVMAMCSGDHLEIGVLHGGSAIICAYAKDWFKQKGNIYGVDPFPGYEPGRTPIPPPPTLLAASANVELHGFQNRVVFFKGYHPPLPAELENMRFASCFLDGDHSFKGVLADWENVKDRVDGVVMFHDVHNPAHGARTVFEIAMRDPDWEFLYLGGKSGAVKRKGYELDSKEKILERAGYEKDTPITFSSNQGDALEGSEDELQEQAEQVTDGQQPRCD